MRAPVAPVGFLLFFFLFLLIWTFFSALGRGTSREEEFQKSMRKEKILTLCLLRSLLGLPFCGMGIDVDVNVDVSGDGEESK